MVFETNTGDQLVIHDEFSYMPENLSGYAKGKFKYSETLSIVMIGEDVYIVEHTDSNKIIQVPLKGDGYYHIEYIVIPTKKWYDSAPEQVKNLYKFVYYSDGKTISKVTLEGTEEVSVEELLQNDTSGTTTIKKDSDDFVSVANLKKCYINLCYQIFSDRGMSACWNKNKIDSELIYKRDLVWMSLNVITYLAELGQFEEITRILTQINGCNGLCKSYTTATASGCGCSKK